jgi:dolichol-phosphate mannosyltransferase
MLKETGVQLSLVVPCLDEAEVLPLLKDRLREALGTLDLRWEVIFVDDGSRDATRDLLAAMHREEPRFKVVVLSRNFGQQTAISAGLACASGEAVAILDADLQDPPELIGLCLRKLREGWDVVYTVRRKRKENLLRRSAYALFYRVLRALTDTDIPLDAGDFCVMRRSVVEVLKRMPERNHFLRGLRAWTGFRQVGVDYERDRRAAGKTKYPLVKLVRLAADGIFSFSILPLRLATGLGLAALLFSLGMGILTLLWRILGFRLLGHTAAELPGWTILAGGMLFFGGLQLLILGCIGEYIGRIHTEIKQRPRWVTREVLGLNSPDNDAAEGRP